MHCDFYDRKQSGKLYQVGNVFDKKYHCAGLDRRYDDDDEEGLCGVGDGLWRLVVGGLWIVCCPTIVSFSSFLSLHCLFVSGKQLLPMAKGEWGPLTKWPFEQRTKRGKALGQLWDKEDESRKREISRTDSIISFISQLFIKPAPCLFRTCEESR